MKSLLFFMVLGAAGLNALTEVARCAAVADHVDLRTPTPLKSLPCVSLETRHSWSNLIAGLRPALLQAIFESQWARAAHALMDASAAPHPRDGQSLQARHVRLQV